MARSPLLRVSVGPLAKGVATEVNVRIDGSPVRWVAVKPDRTPDTGFVHSLGVNVASPVLDIPDAGTYAIDLTHRPNGDSYLARTIYLTAGTASTTFDVSAHV